MMRVSLARVPQWCWVVLVAAAFYAGALPWFYVGAFNDDAAYISGALSLWNGNYRELYLPGRPALTTYPPGYPLFLMPFAVVIRPNWDLLKFTSLALCLVNLFLAWRLFGLWLSQRARLCALWIFALNPLVVIHSGAVMSEPLCTACLLVAFLMLHRVLSKQSSWTVWGLAGLVGYTGLVRSAALVLVPAVVAGLLYGRRFGAAIRVLAGAAMILGAWGIRTYLAAHQWSGYAIAWVSNFSELTTPWALMQNTNRVAFAFLSTWFPGLDLPYAWPGFLATGALVGLVLFVLYLANRVHSSSERPVRALLFAIACLSASWFGVHAFWTTPSTRYAMPILPLMTGLLACGISYGYQKAHPRFRLVLAAVLLGLAVYSLYVDFGTYRRARQPEPLKPERPAQTFSYIRSHIPEAAIIQTAKSAETYLYTGRLCVGLFVAQDAENYRYGVLRSSATHMLARPMRMPSAGVNFDRAWSQNQSWAASWHEAFRPLYRNAQEGTAVYEVVPDQDYLNAYEWYRQAKEDLNASRVEAGIAKLDKSLSLYPRLSSALNAYGAALLIQGRNLPLAEAKLRAAIRVRPQYALALLNLARVYERAKQKSKARICLERAQGAIAATGEFEYLGPFLAHELRAL